MWFGKLKIKKGLEQKTTNSLWYQRFPTPINYTFYRIDLIKRKAYSLNKSTISTPNASETKRNKLSEKFVLPCSSL